MKQEIREVATNCDVKLELQIAQVHVTNNVGTRRIKDEVCLSLTDVEGVSLQTFLTVEQVDRLVSRLNEMKEDIESNCPF